MELLKEETMNLFILCFLPMLIGWMMTEFYKDLPYFELRDLREILAK